MGANHNYRYVRVKGANPSGTYSATTRNSSINISDYAYVDTTGVPSLVDTQLLWQNTSPTSNMSAQNISITNLPSSRSGYERYVRIKTRVKASYASHFYMLVAYDDFVHMDGTNQKCIGLGANIASDGNYIRSLTTTNYSAGSITLIVGNAYKIGSSTMDNQYAIPVEIYVVWTKGSLHY